jgi:hypothetical protein
MSEKPESREKQQSSEKDPPPYEPPSVEEIETQTISTAPGAGVPVCF